MPGAVLDAVCIGWTSDGIPVFGTPVGRQPASQEAEVSGAGTKRGLRGLDVQEGPL